ncbi:putative glyceraldehyde-3-phosphate dehydrogenase (phosphorylating) [Helianthus anomalus]
MDLFLGFYSLVIDKVLLPLNGKFSQMVFRVTTMDVSVVDLTTRNERRLLMSRTRLPQATFEGL